MPHYRMKTDVEAWMWDGSKEMLTVLREEGLSIHSGWRDDYTGLLSICVGTVAGGVAASAGDYIIRDVRGAWTVLSEREFLEAYAPVSDPVRDNESQ